MLAQNPPSDNSPKRRAWRPTKQRRRIVDMRTCQWFVRSDKPVSYPEAIEYADRWRARGFTTSVSVKGDGWIVCVQSLLNGGAK